MYRIVSLGLPSYGSWISFYLNDCRCSSCKCRSSQPALATQHRSRTVPTCAETWRHASSSKHLSAKLCLFKVGDRAGWPAYISLVVISSGCRVLLCDAVTREAEPKSPMLWLSSTLAPTMLDQQQVTVWLGEISLDGSCDRNPSKGSCRQQFWLWCKCEFSLSGTLWLWLTYLLLTVQGEPWSSLRYVALCLQTAFRVSTECGILFQMHICLGVFFKTLLRILQASLDWQLAQKLCHPNT